MKERGILFSGDMVRAILNGKTQTRRPIKPQPRETSEWLDVDPRCNLDWKSSYCGLDYIKSRCPFGQPGDRLWARETWWHGDWINEDNEIIENGITLYRADEPNIPGWPDYWEYKWKPSIYMPRWASRILLEIDEIRVERLQDISDFDCEAEGVRPSIDGNGKDWRENETGWRRTFRQLWDLINLKCNYGWDKNPWVWVIKFHMLEANHE